MGVGNYISKNARNEYLCNEHVIVEIPWEMVEDDTTAYFVENLSYETLNLVKKYIEERGNRYIKSSEDDTRRFSLEMYEDDVEFEGYTWNPEIMCCTIWGMTAKIFGYEDEYIVEFGSDDEVYAAVAERLYHDDYVEHWSYYCLEEDDERFVDSVVEAIMQEWSKLAVYVFDGLSKNFELRVRVCPWTCAEYVPSTSA